jgi:lysyl-tRNA synthetase class 2
MSDAPPPADPLVAALVALFQGFTGDDLPRLEAALDERDREVAWKLAMGMDVATVATQLHTDPAGLRGDVARLVGVLAALQSPTSHGAGRPGAIEPLDGLAAEQRQARLAKVEAIRAAGGEPYPVGAERTATLAELAERHAGLEPGTETAIVESVVGRVMLLRDQGKLIFATIRDGEGSIQLFVSRAELGDEAFAAFRELDLGDWVGATGAVMTTRRGELSIKVSAATLLSKAIRPWPDKWHGLADVDTRFRQRYVDLAVNEDARRVFEIRFATVDAIRRILRERRYVEVETPVLQPVAGGATARPFVTHHHALDMDLFLRIALELPLKRLLVGGLERVFEIGRVFRNEGISTRHNPEFTMLEAYEAFTDYHGMMDLTEALVAGTAQAVLGSTTVSVDGLDVSLAPPFHRVPMLELIEEYANVWVHPGMPVADLQRICDDLGVPYERTYGPGKLVLEIYEKTTEPNVLQPTFVCDYPIEVSPLARRHRTDPLLTERFELLVNGRELANAFTELNDPVDQLARFEEQARLKAAGDDEANDVDEDYVRALEYGLPPCGGMGMGIDRLVMLLAGVGSIREVLLFPHLRPEVSGSATP